jgi:hypothetical protein
MAGGIKILMVAGERESRGSRRRGAVGLLAVSGVPLLSLPSGPRMSHITANHRSPRRCRGSVSNPVYKTNESMIDVNPFYALSQGGLLGKRVHTTAQTMSS